MAYYVVFVSQYKYVYVYAASAAEARAIVARKEAKG
jgi:hypothetical protein